MSPQPETPDKLELRDLWLRLQDLEDGSLPDKQRDELMAWLDESPAARRAYLEYFDQSAVFRMEGAKMHEAGLLPVVDLPARSRRLFQRSILAAAAVIALSAVVATLIAIKQPTPEMLSAAVAADTQWAVDGDLQSNDATEFNVVEGSTVRVASGIVELRLESGTVMVLQGPATASFPKLHRPVLKSGWLWIDSADSDDPFEVVTPDVLVRDIGTRFGVRVSEGKPVEVHLIEGLVDIVEKGTGKLIFSLTPVGKGFAVPTSGKPYELPLELDPFPELPALLLAKPNYRTTILSQTPVGYWQLDEEDHGALVNELAEGSTGSHGVEVVMGVAGVGKGDGFSGFHEENRSVELRGEDPQKSVLLELDSPLGVSRQEGAVAFWIRRLPGHERDEVLWLAGLMKTESMGPEETMLHTQLTASGRVEFFIENGAFDVRLSSTRSIVDGGWHHIVASWGPSSVDLFVDGKRVAHDGDSRILKEGITAGRYVRFGKPSSDLAKQDFHPFNGWVDELALWSRPLTHAEVAHQFDSARGIPTN